MNIELCRETFSSGKYRTLLCGFSGGADSTAALLVASHFRDELGFRVVAVHFDHHLRPESGEEAQRAKAFAEAGNIDFLKIDLDISDDGSGIENAARTARLKEWKKLSELYPESAVVLGHHADDKLENLFIRLFRGSNVSGLSGLREVSTVQGVTFLRPLLHLRRSEIETFLRENNVSCWTSDSSNSDNTYLRNYLRNTLIPEAVIQAPFAGKGLFRSCEALACDADFIEQETEKVWNCGDPSSRDFWLQLHDAVAIRALRKLISQKSGCNAPVSGALFTRFKSEVSKSSGEGRKIPVSNAVTLIVQGEKVDVVLPEPGTVFWDWKEVECIQYGDVIFTRAYTDSPDCPDASSASFDADKLDEYLKLTAPVQGERFSPFGRKQQISIKKLRTDRKIPAYLNIPVLRISDGTAVWLPFIRNGQYAAVTRDTEKIVTFYAKRV